MTQNHPLKIGIVCGEHSGDRLGAELISKLQKTHDVNLFGVGGPKLEALGVNSLFDFSEINIMGLIDPLINYRRLSQLRKSLINQKKNLNFQQWSRKIIFCLKKLFIIKFLLIS